MIGLSVGRWWALIAAAGLGVLVAVSDESELDGWFLGVLYAGLTALGISIGLVTRRFAKRFVKRP